MVRLCNEPRHRRVHVPRSRIASSRNGGGLADASLMGAGWRGIRRLRARCRSTASQRRCRRTEADKELPARDVRDEHGRPRRCRTHRRRAGVPCRTQPRRVLSPHRLWRAGLRRRRSPSDRTRQCDASGRRRRGRDDGRDPRSRRREGRAGLQPDRWRRGSPTSTHRVKS